AVSPMRTSRSVRSWDSAITRLLSLARILRFSRPPAVRAIPPRAEGERANSPESALCRGARHDARRDAAIERHLGSLDLNDQVARRLRHHSDVGTLHEAERL